MVSRGVLIRTEHAISYNCGVDKNVQVLRKGENYVLKIGVVGYGLTDGLNRTKTNGMRAERGLTKADEEISRACRNSVPQIPTTCRSPRPCGRYPRRRPT